jgi:ABC-2 type transport system permease protein
VSPRGIVALVARREMSERLRSKSFLASTAITLLIVVAVAVLPSLFGDGDDPYRVAAGDRSSTQVVEAAREVARGFDAEVEVVRYSGPAKARAALADDELDALVTARAIESREELEGDLPEILQAANARVAASRVLDRLDVEPSAKAFVLSPAPLAVRTQEKVDPDAEARSGLAFAAVLLLYGQLLTFGFWVASGVVEEKASRVVEVLLATIRPSQLLAGKIIGLGLLGLGQLLLIAALGVGAAGAVGSIDVDGDLLAAAGLALLWFVLGYAFYSCAFACAGAIVPRQEELQSSMTPLTTVILVSFFVAFAVIQEPDGTLATISSFIPFTAPMTMPPRIALGEAPVWQIVGAILVTLAATAALIPLAARIYSGAVLRTGSAVKLREAYRAARA